MGADLADEDWPDRLDAWPRGLIGSALHDHPSVPPLPSHQAAGHLRVVAVALTAPSPFARLVSVVDACVAEVALGIRGGAVTVLTSDLTDIPRLLRQSSGTAAVHRI